MKNDWEIISKTVYKRNPNKYEYKTEECLVNPDLFKILEYCRENGVIPNITINGAKMSSEYYDNLAKYCGAIAVSNYGEQCYNAVKELTDRGMKQINIHQLLCEESLDQCYQIIKDKKTDLRLAKLNAIVFLCLKPKGDRNTYNIIKDRKKYLDLIKFAVESEVQFGFDSCFAPIFQDIATDIFPEDKLKSILDTCEPCESFGLFSMYCDVKGHFYPCSFIPGTNGWEEGIDLTKIDDFLKEVWFSSQINKEREKSLKCSRKCLPYPEIYNALNKD